MKGWAISAVAPVSERPVCPANIGDCGVEPTAGDARGVPWRDELRLLPDWGVRGV